MLVTWRDYLKEEESLLARSRTTGSWLPQPMKHIPIKTLPRPVAIVQRKLHQRQHSLITALVEICRAG